MPKEKKVKRRRARKAPGAPKRSLSAYMIFGKELRPSIMQANPSMPVTEVMKEIARRWAETQQEDRLPYEEKARQDKQRYEQELASYTGPLKVPPKQKYKDPDKPKRGLSAYMIFAKDMRPLVVAENPTLAVPDVMKEVGARWARLSDSDKVPYKERSEEDKDRYRRERTEYDRMQFLNAPKKKKKDPRQPKRCLSAYMFFSKVMREIIKEEKPHASVSEIMKDVGTRWAMLSEDEKRPFEEKAVEDKLRYEQELREYGQLMSMAEPQHESALTHALHHAPPHHHPAAHGGVGAELDDEEDEEAEDEEEDEEGEDDEDEEHGGGGHPHALPHAHEAAAHHAHAQAQAHAMAAHHAAQQAHALAVAHAQAQAQAQHYQLQHQQHQQMLQLPVPVGMMTLPGMSGLSHAQQLHALPLQHGHSMHPHHQQLAHHQQLPHLHDQSGHPQLMHSLPMSSYDHLEAVTGEHQ